jgi:hypothetical protein
MTMKEVLDAVLPLNREQRVEWLIDLGWAMTVSARAGYPLANQAEPIPHLMAFNKLQHQLFNYLTHSRTKDDWTIEDFIRGLCEKAIASGVNGDVGWALKSSLERIAKSSAEL